MSFNAQAKRVRDQNRPLGYRRRALSNCLEHFCLLTKCSFSAVSKNLNSEYRISPVGSEQELLGALLAVERERERYANLLKEFTNAQRKRLAGCNHPSLDFAPNFSSSGSE